jgi:glycosyltransferase involved in cell wall biosynthesis
MSATYLTVPQLDDSAPAPDVALVMPTLYSGGAERVHLNLAEYLVARRLRVDLVICKYLGALRDQVPAGVRLICLDSRKVMLSLPQYLGYLRAARPPVVLSSVENISIVSCLGRMMSRHRHSLFVRLDSSLWDARPLFRQPRRWPWLASIATTFLAADEFVAVSTGVGNQLARLPGFSRKPIHVVHNPVIRADFRDKFTEPAVLPPTVQPDRPCLIAVGRLHPLKDYPTLLRAFALAVQQQPSELLILGEGDDRAALEAEARALGVSEHVHFLGYVENPLAYMHHAHAFVLSSIQEGFANVLVEALASGTPVISTDCPHGPREILVGGRFGTLVPIGDTASLAAAMVRQLRAAKPPMSEALTRHLQLFTVERVGAMYADILGVGALAHRAENGGAEPDSGRADRY